MHGQDHRLAALEGGHHPTGVVAQLADRDVHAWHSVAFPVRVRPSAAGATLEVVSLTLVTGPANSAKAGELFGAFRARAARGALLVVPTRADVAAYERELAGDGTLVGGRVTSFGGLVREIARRAGFAADVLGPFARERIVLGVIGELRLEVLAPSAASEGFAPAAADLLAELGAERVDPARLRVALRAWAGEDLGRRAYAEEVGALHSGYAAALARAGRTDDAVFAWGALDALRHEPAAWGGTPVLLYGFDDLTPPQLDAVSALAGPAGADVWVSLPWEPRAAFAGRARTVQELLGLAPRVLELPASDAYYAPASRAALHHLERGLFEQPEPTLWRADPGDAVAVLDAGGERAEAELVAAEVAALLERGAAPEDVAVVHRAPGTVAEGLIAALAAHDIATAWTGTVPAGHTTLGRALRGLLGAALDPGAGAGALLDWLRAPGLLDVPELADALELACRQERIATARDARARWERDHPSFSLDALDVLATAADRGSGPLLRTARGQLERLWGAPHRGAAPLLCGALADEARTYAALAGALDELAALADAGLGAPLTPRELPAALAAVPVALGESTRPGAVLLCDPLGIRARRFRAVIVCGLQEGVFPRPPRPEPFLSEEEREALAQASGLRLGAGLDPLAEERYLFYACVSRATERVVLSYRSSDEEGRAESASPFLADVRALFAPLPTRRRRLADVTWPLAEAPTPRERARAEAAAAPREAPPALGDLELPAVRALARHGEILSAGAVESYASCPVRWLVEKQLEPAELAPEAEALRRGAFIHTVLERTLRALEEATGTARIHPGNRARAEAELHRAVEAERAGLEAELPRAVARSTVRAAEADLRRYLRLALAEGELPFEPAEFELRFGFEDEESRPALELGTGPDVVRVRGAIDRLDLGPDGTALVRDYKSGRADPAYAGGRWVESGRLQVALYMLAVRDLLDLMPAGGLYQPLRGGEDADLRPRGLVRDEGDLKASGAFVNGDVCASERVDELLAQAEEEVVRLAGELRTGKLTPRPDACGGYGCRYPGICRSAAA